MTVTMEFKFLISLITPSMPTSFNENASLDGLSAEKPCSGHLGVSESQVRPLVNRKFNQPLPLLTTIKRNESPSSAT